MKATCPVCGFYSALEGFVAIEEYKQAIGVMSELGGDETVKLVIRYLGLFRKPNSDRALTGSRVLKLTRELRDYFRAEHIQWKQQRAYTNARWYWIQAMQKLLDRAEQGQVERPLTSHNLLRCMAYEQADREFEQVHREKENRAAHRIPDGARPDDPSPQNRTGGRPSRPDFQAQAENIRQVKDKLGIK